MFYEDVIAEREGGQPMNNNISAGNSSDNTSNTRVHYLDYEAPTNVEWLWSITVAIFVLFGMIGAFVSGKWADYFGRQVHVCDSISLFNIIYVCSEVDLRLSRWMYKFTYQSGPFGYCNARKLCCESFQTCCFVLWTCKFVSRKWTAIHYGYFTTTKPTPSSCTFFSSWINKMSSQRKNWNWICSYFLHYRKRGMILITFIMFLAALFGGIPKVTGSFEVLIVHRALVGLHCGTFHWYLKTILIV